MLQGACQSIALGNVDGDRRLAPLWHTRLLLLLLLAVPATALTLHQGFVAPAPATASRLLVVHTPLLVTSIGLALYVCRLGLPDWCARDLLGPNWFDAGRVAADVALATLLSVAVIGVETALISVAGLPQSLASHALVARTSVERWLWLPLAATVGICEELVYRGYLQRQFTAISQSAGVGIVAQALLFGIAHGEQGGAAVLRFALYGAFFGWLARSRRSLLPCMLSHVAIDSLAGLGA